MSLSFLFILLWEPPRIGVNLESYGDLNDSKALVSYGIGFLVFGNLFYLSLSFWSEEYGLAFIELLVWFSDFLSDVIKLLTVTFTIFPLMLWINFPSFAPFKGSGSSKSPFYFSFKSFEVISGPGSPFKIDFVHTWFGLVPYLKLIPVFDWIVCLNGTIVFSPQVILLLFFLWVLGYVF